MKRWTSTSNLARAKAATAMFAWLSLGRGGGLLEADAATASYTPTNVQWVAKAREPIRPIPQTLALDGRKVLLGEKLFGERMLSRDNTLACSSCHDLQKGGTDQLAHSIGINGAIGALNAPTVFNSGFNSQHFWNGRARTLEEQVDGPLQGALEMGSTWEDVLSKLQRSSEYRRAFSGIYSDGIRSENVKDAIAEYERSLITPNSLFDRFVRGDMGALSEAAKEGYRKFRSYGCSTCHQGVNIGGNMFQPLGVMGDYFKDRGHITPADLGRFNVTGREEDRHVFKVPGLRNIALTWPYLHDGTARSLAEAVNIMARYQLGRELPGMDVKQIVEFLKSLTGEYQGRILE